MRIIAACVYVLLLGLVIKPYWKILRAQAKRGGGRLQFTIADCWGASLGLAITAYLTALAVQHATRNYDALTGIEVVLATAIFFGASQLSGAVIVLATGMAPGRAGAAQQHSTSAWLVALGTIMGLLMPLMGPFLVVFQMREETAAASPADRLKMQRLERLKARAKRPSR